MRLACCGESARDQPDRSLLRNTEPGQLWFTACLELTALSALAEGYEVFTWSTHAAHRTSSHTRPPCPDGERRGNRNDHLGIHA